MMKYKVGDVVLIKSLDWFKKNQKYGCISNSDTVFIETMSEFCGQYAKIISIYENLYYLNIDKGFHSWSDFMFVDSSLIDEKIGVHCRTQEETAEVFDYAVSLGFRDLSENWKIYKEDTCFNIAESMYCSISFYMKNGYKVISAKEFLNLGNMKQVKINIPEGYEIDEEKSTFTNIVFKPIKQVKTWEDLKIIEGYYITDYSTIRHTSTINKKSNENVFKTEKEAKSALALAKVSQLMPYYGESFTDEEWKDFGLKKFIIKRVNGELLIDLTGNGFTPLAFRNLNLAEEFLKNNEQLIKDYLML